MIRPVISLIKALQSNTAVGEVAAGAVLALYAGFTPFKGTHQIFLFLIFFFFKMNKAATLILLPLTKLIYILGLSLLADKIGTYLLMDLTFLHGFWSWVTHAPILAYLNLNNTLVLGGFVIALALSMPVYFLVKKAVAVYHARVGQKVQQWAVVRWLRGLWIVKWCSGWWPGSQE
jgi:uncharacterized protein (TIGR03546 family)